MQTDFRNRIQISLLNKRATIIQMCTIQRQTFNEGWDGSSTGIIRSEEIKLVLGENLRDSPSIKWIKKNLILFFPSNFSRLILFFFFLNSPHLERRGDSCEQASSQLTFRAS